MGCCGRDGGCWVKFKEEAELIPFPWREDGGKGC